MSSVQKKLDKALNSLEKMTGKMEAAQNVSQCIKNVGKAETSERTSISRSLWGPLFHAFIRA